MNLPTPDDLDELVRARCAAGDASGAATLVLERHGREILEYLVAIARSEADGADAFSLFAEHLWRGLPGFRGEAKVRTWSYAVARRALARVRRAPHRRRGAALDDVPELAQLEAQVRTRTLSYLRTAVKDQVAALRDQLAPDDQALLILRIDRKLEWRDVALAMADEDDPPAGAELTRRAATLRKRFERIKDDLRTRVGKPR